MKIVYIASPYSAKTKKIEQQRYEEITRVAALLHSMHPNKAFILPITQSHNLKTYNKKLKGDFKTWKKIDLKFVSVSDEVWIVAMEGFEKSIGVIAELNYAIKKHKIVKFVNPRTLEILSFDDSLSLLDIKMNKKSVKLTIKPNEEILA